MVKAEKIYSPQGYLEGVMGDCYIIDGDNDIELIERILYEHGYELWNYPMSEIGHIVENELDVVLVDCMIWNAKKEEFDHEYRWFEVPEGFGEEEEEDYTPSSTGGDYSPSNPWDAPGMSVSDFI